MNPKPQKQNQTPSQTAKPRSVTPSAVTQSFLEALWNMGDDGRKSVYRAWLLWAANPKHPSLEFKPLDRTAGILYVVRCGSRHRAAAVIDRGTVLWFWCGTHEQYNGLYNAWLSAPVRLQQNVIQRHRAMGRGANWYRDALVVTGSKTRFTSGYCAEFAKALHDVFGWPTCAFVVERYDDLAEVDFDEVIHAGARHPSGRFADVRGLRVVSDVMADCVSDAEMQGGKRPKIVMKDLSPEDLENLVGMDDDAYRMARNYIKNHKNLWPPANRRMAMGAMKISRLAQQFTEEQYAAIRKILQASPGVFNNGNGRVTECSTEMTVNGDPGGDFYIQTHYDVRSGQIRIERYFDREAMQDQYGSSVLIPIDFGNIGATIQDIQRAVLRLRRFL